MNMLAYAEQLVAEERARVLKLANGTAREPPQASSALPSMIPKIERALLEQHAVDRVDQESRKRYNAGTDVLFASTPQAASAWDTARLESQLHQPFGPDVTETAIGRRARVLREAEALFGTRKAVDAKLSVSIISPHSKPGKVQSDR
jgi:hypothetical protein